MDITELGYYEMIDSHRRELDSMVRRITKEAKYAESQGYESASVKIPQRFKDGSYLSSSEQTYIIEQLSYMFDIN